MLEEFANAIEETVKGENCITENGAVGHATAGSALVDFCFRASSYRNMSSDDICRDFARAYDEDPVLAVKMMFMVGDIRGGMGERRTFRECLLWLARNHNDVAGKVIGLVPEYSRWDIVVDMLGTDVDGVAFGIIQSQLDRDSDGELNGKPISLLAKWLPSPNTTSKATRAKARSLYPRLGMTEKQYRRRLSALRSHLNVVERQMSDGKWDRIDYSSVPSKANVLYRNAFLRHDEERRKKFLDDVQNGKGDAKLNSSVAFPHDIVKGYDIGYGCVPEHDDTTLEEMWKALPDYVGDGGESMICMVDGSGSMGCEIGGTSLTCHDVARGIGIYFSERLGGAFKDKYISFGADPHLVSFGKCRSLREKLALCEQYDDCSNTNVEKAFDLVLQTAVHHKLSQEQLPKGILVISDMEFDAATCDHSEYCFGHGSYMAHQKTLFDHIAEKYEKAGYRMPRLVFWNVCSRTKAIPVKENESGVALVSGFSPSVAGMVLSCRLDPREVVVEQLSKPRYDAVEQALKS